MISDRVILEEIRQSWVEVEALRDKIKRDTLGSFTMGSAAAIFIADSAHNLPLIHAFAVLNNVLQQIAKERQFKYKGIILGKLLAESKEKLPWKNFAIIEEGVERRNDAAHRNEVLPRGDCWKYIDAIKEQLIEWNILESGEENA